MADVAYNALHMAAAVNDLEQMEALLEGGEVDVDGTDEYNWTALHYAANSGHYDAVALLIEWEADLSAVRLCPLLCYVVLRCGDGADHRWHARQETHNGDTPITLANKNGHAHITALIEENLE